MSEKVRRLMNFWQMERDDSSSLLLLFMMKKSCSRSVGSSMASGVRGGIQRYR